MHSIDSKIYIPTENRDTSVRTTEAEFIYSFIKEHGLTRTLEIGFAYGYSAAYIISATQSIHVIIEPSQKKYENLGVKNLETLGFGNLYDLKKDFSHNALPKLLDEGRKFQFVFVDGGHKFDQIFIDWYYTDLLLEVGGYVLFHDNWMRSTQVVVGFIRANRKDYQEIEIPLKNLVLFKKISATDDRAWNHFEEFYPPKPEDVFKTLRGKLKKE